MSAPVPRFLRQLAPGVRADMRGVRAVLPPRFGPMALASEDFAREAIAPAAPAVRLQGTTAPAAHAAHTITAALPVAAAALVQAQGAEDGRLPSQLAKASVPAAALERTAPLQRDSASQTSAPALVRTAAPVSPASEAPRMPHPAAADERTLLPARGPLPAPVQPTVRAPLRQSTVVHHAASLRSAAPPVVQVTIDRIDVRATPAPSAARPPARARSAPTTSLGDYLRQLTPRKADA